MALTATVEPTAKNVRIDYDVPASGASVTLERVGPSLEPAVVRAWDHTPASPGPIIARDFEVPIGVPLTYTARPYNSSGGALTPSTTTITVPSAGCADTWLTDLARAGNTQLITVEELAELSYVVPATVHDVITRRAPIVSSDIAHTPEFELSFLTDTDAQREQARFTLGNGFPVLLRTPPEDGVGNLYFAVLGYSEQRILTLATEQARRFAVQARQVTRPDAALYQPAAPVTYDYVRATFATYTALRSGRLTYDAVAYDWAGASPVDVFPWPPTDV